MTARALFPPSLHLHHDQFIHLSLVQPQKRIKCINEKSVSYIGSDFSRKKEGKKDDEAEARKRERERDKIEGWDDDERDEWGGSIPLPHSGSLLSSYLR